MPSALILVIFSELSHAEAVADTVRSALSHAAHPFGIRFGLPERFAGEAPPLPQEAGVGMPAGDSLLFYPEEDGLRGALPLLRNETHFLALKGAHEFGEKWDQGLLARLRKQKHGSVLLTGMVSSPEEGSQAFLPALSGNFGGPGVKLARGLPVVCGSAPVKTMLVNPAFFFGKTDFLRQAETEASLLSIAAFVAGYPVYALEKPLLWPVAKPKDRWLAKPGADVLPRPNLARFERLAGFSFDRKLAGVRATLGLFSTEDGYPQQLPARLTLARRAKALTARKSRSMPMAVTAFFEMPDALKPAVSYMIRFSYLRALSGLPLILYAGGRQERALRGMLPNTFSYPDNALLPKSLLWEGMTPMQHFQRNKLPLLQRAMNACPGFTHYAWVDFDILPHPVCPQAAPDFSALMDETVHLATVDGEPDGAFMVVPCRRLKLLVREVEALCQMDAALRRSFSERAMLKRLIQKFPDLFTLHPMPGKHLLFLTGFDPSLLSEEERARLAVLPPATRGAAPAANGKEREL